MISYKCEVQQYLRGDDFYGCHEAICDDGYAHEDVHETDEVDKSPPCLLPQWRVEWQPDRQQDTGSTHHDARACPLARPCRVSEGLRLLGGRRSLHNLGRDGGAGLGQEEEGEEEEWGKVNWGGSHDIPE